MVRSLSILAPGLVALAAGGAMVVLGAPADGTARAALALIIGIAGTAWAVLALERFVLIAVLGAMMLPIALVQPAGAQVALVDVLLVVAVASWLVRSSVGAAPPPWTSGNRLFVPTLLFAGLTAASLAWSVAPGETVKTIVQMVEIVVVVPLLFASLPRSLATIRTGLLVYVGLSCVLALVTLAHFLPRVAAGDVTGQYLPGLHKNAIGSFLAAGLVLAYGLWLAERRSAWRWTLGAAAVVELAGLVATISRGSLIGAALGVVAVSVLLRRRRLLTLALVIAATAGFLLTIGPSPGPQLRDGGYESSEVRGYSFDNAIEKIAERPLLGTGAGTYEDYIPEFDIGLRDPNNLFLLTWAEIGILGLGVLGFLLYRLGALVLRARRLPEAAAVPAVLAGGVFLSLLAHFQVDSTWNRGSATLAFAMVGLVLAAGRLAPRSGGQHRGIDGGPDRPPPGPGPPAPGRSAVDKPPTRPGPAVAARPAPAVAPEAGTRPGPAVAARSAPAAPPEPGTRPGPAVTAPPAPAVARRPAPPVAPRPAPPQPAGRAESLRVLHVVTSDAFAGIERHVIRLAGELRRLGCSAELACPPSAARMRAEAAAAGIPVHPSASTRRRAWLGAVVREVAAHPPHVVHLHDGRSAVAGSLLGPLGRALVVRTQHFTRPASVERTGWRGEASLGLHRTLNRRLDGYVAVSRSVAEAARERRETGAAEVTVIPPGIELPDDQLVSRAAAERRHLGRPVVAYVGRLEREKRLDVLLEAIPDLLQQLPDCRFVVAGAGGSGEQLRALAGRLGIHDKLDWTGEVAHPGAVLQSAHVYVNPSPAEGFGLATAEAMAFGLPVVAVASGGSAEIVEDGVTGILVPADDAGALATAVVRLAGDLPLAAEMGEAARRRAARYGARHTAESTLAFYRRLRQAART